jgi:esterase
MHEVFLQVDEISNTVEIEFLIYFYRMNLMNYKVLGTGEPILILHGLFGSLDNWQTIAKNLSEDGHQIIIADVRNHGRSFHDDDMRFETLNDDILHLMNHLNINKIILIGHSMGGKIAMNFATNYPEKVESLFVVDVAPYKYAPHHNIVFKALYSVDLDTVRSRAEIETIIRETIDEEGVVQFMMKGIHRSGDNELFEWKFNLDILHKNYEYLIQEIPTKKYLGQTTFIKGERSDYLSYEKLEKIPVLFPNSEIIEIKNSGHWVHAENQMGFLEGLKSKFL